MYTSKDFKIGTLFEAKWPDLDPVYLCEVASIHEDFLTVWIVGHSDPVWKPLDHTYTAPYDVVSKIY
jgi:hypothetical protein